MAYSEVEVVVDGALESVETFFDDALMTEFLNSVETDAMSDGYPTEVYVMFHDHALELDCECIQFEQSLKPKYVYNIEGSKGDWQ